MNSAFIILMYHGIVDCPADIPPGREPGASVYDVSYVNFRQQINLLRKNGCHVVTSINTNSSEKSFQKIVLTFDDGEGNNYSRAYKVLEELGFNAYFFVIVNRVGTPGYLTWDMLKEMTRQGMIIGSHSLNHNFLERLSEGDLKSELEESKHVLEEKLSVLIDSISVPRGFYNQKILQMAQETGYKNMFVSQKTKQTDPCFERVAVKGNWNLHRFDQALSGKTPWPEKLACGTQKCAKTILGSHGYDKLRTLLLKESR